MRPTRNGSAKAQPLTPPGTVAGTLTVAELDSRRTWAREVADGLAKMLPAERQFILSSYADGLTHSDIATKAGVSDGEISRAIASGMQKLSARLANTYRWR